MMMAKQKEIMAKFGLQTNDFQESSQNNSILSDFSLVDAMTLPSAQGNQNLIEKIKDVELRQTLQTQNINLLKQSILHYSTKKKLTNFQALYSADFFPKLNEDEEIWPLPKDLENLSKDQLKTIQVSTLRIIQKNSSRSRGDEWGHAFFL